MSASPRKRTISRTSQQVRFVPKGDIAGLERDGGAAFRIGVRVVNIKAAAVGEYRRQQLRVAMDYVP
jgi:hypothetical protein